jgi:hypothetical protein
MRALDDDENMGLVAGGTGLGGLPIARKPFSNW